MENYPTFEEMEIILMWNFRLDAEYGKMNHEICKRIFENSTNEDIIKECMKQIEQVGGRQALVVNLEILLTKTPLLDKKLVQKYYTLLIN